MQIGEIKFNNYPLFMAPMEDITDSPFRRICREFGADMVYTEFIASEGLIRDARKSKSKLEFSEDERPIGSQIFGHDIESMKKATGIAERANPDLIDINFGCPVKKVVNKGAGAALLKEPEKMAEMAATVVKTTKLPVTVKTRLGWDESSRNIVEVAERLQDAGIQALTIHGRTRSQVYGGKADWTLIGEVKNNPRIKIPVIGNGDIITPQKALEMRNTYGVDGIMIGRAAVGNPWLFRRTHHFLQSGNLLPEPDIRERINICLRHLHLSIALKGERTAIYEMRKFYSNYFKGLYDFKKCRVKLMGMSTLQEIEDLFARLAEGRAINFY